MVFRALILALALRITITLNSSGVIVPLFQNSFLQEFRSFLPLSALMVGLFTVKKGESPWAFLYMGLLSICVLIFNYSSTTAFYPHVIILCLFAFLSFGMEDKKLKSMAVFFFSMTFLTSALFKMNGNFLNGSEFSTRSDFLIFLKPVMDVRSFEPFSVFLAWVTVLVELSIGILVWFRPLLTVQLSLLCFCFLSVIHPPVVFVYFCYLPFYFTFREKKVSEKINNPFFWLILLILMSLIFALGITYRTLLLSTALIVFQLWLMKNTDLKSDAPQWVASWKVFVPGGFVLLTMVARFLGAPAPLGYSMFSGVESKPVRVLETGNVEVCSYLGQNLRRTIVSDLRFVWKPGSPQCYVLFPTAGSYEYLKNHLCEKKSQEFCHGR